MTGRLRRLLSRVLSTPTKSPPRSSAPPQREAGHPSGLPAGLQVAADYTGRAKIVYAPDPDGNPDPGEVVWTWVPYEEDPTVGKDRPVLVVGRDGQWLLGLMLSSQDHEGNPEWFELGAGAWDHDGRPSSVRLDRVLRLDPTHVRREGAALDRARFDRVAGQLRARHDWT